MGDHNILHNDEALFDEACFGIEHKDYNQTDDIPDLNETWQNNVQDSNTSTHSHTLSNRENDVPSNDILGQALQSTLGNNVANSRPDFYDQNEFINALLAGTLTGPMSNPENVNAAFTALIEAGEFQSDFVGCGSPGWEGECDEKGGKGCSDMVDDNDDIHNQGSNAMDEGSPSCLPNHYTDQPGSSKSPPFSPPFSPPKVKTPVSPPEVKIQPFETEIVTNSALDSQSILSPSLSTSFSPINHDFDSGMFVGETITVGPVRIQEPEKPFIDIRDPCHNTNFYQVEKEQLSSFLKENGRQVRGIPKLSEAQITRLVNRFCDPRELEYCTEGDARSIIDSGYDVKNVPLRNRAIRGKFNCKFCPIMQKHERGFERKEDIKRHYHQHLSFVRFRCKYCDYKNARTDHMKNHMNKCHPTEKSGDYHKK